VNRLKYKEIIVIHNREYREVIEFDMITIEN
jgi:hypothetical protein